MVTIEHTEGSPYKFNLTPEKEQKLIDLWKEHMNKTIRLTTTDGDVINVKLSEITDCYLGTKAKREAPKNADSILDGFKDLFGKGSSNPFNDLFGKGKL